MDSSLPSFLNLQPLAPSASCYLLSALCSLLLTILTDTTHEPAVNKDVHQPAVLFTTALLVRSTLLRKCGKAAEYVRRTIAAHSITPPPQPFRVSGSLTDDSPPTLAPPPRAPLLLRQHQLNLNTKQHDPWSPWLSREEIVSHPRPMARPMEMGDCVHPFPFHCSGLCYRTSCLESDD